MAMTRLFFLLFLGIMISLVSGSFIFPGKLTFEWFNASLEVPLATVFTVLLLVFIGYVFIKSFFSKIFKVGKKYQRFFAEKRQEKIRGLLNKGINALCVEKYQEAWGHIKGVKVLDPSNSLGLVAKALLLYHDKNLFFKNSTPEDEKINDFKILSLKREVLELKEENNWEKREGKLNSLLLEYPTSSWVQEEIIYNHIQLCLKGKEIKESPIRKCLPKERLKKYEAALLWIQSKKEEESTFGLRAHQEDLENPIYAIQAAKTLAKEKNMSKALKVLRKTYNLKPNRFVGEGWQSLNNTLTPMEQYKGLESFTSDHPNSPETFWLLANLALRAQLWGQAKTFIDQLMSLGETQEIWALKMCLDVKNDPLSYSMETLAKELIKFPKGSVWQCAECSFSIKEWDLICPYCDASLKFEWCFFPNELKNKKVISKLL